MKYIKKYDESSKYSSSKKEHEISNLKDILSYIEDDGFKYEIASNGDTYYGRYYYYNVTFVDIKSLKEEFNLIDIKEEIYRIIDMFSDYSIDIMIRYITNTSAGIMNLDYIRIDQLDENWGNLKNLYLIIYEHKK